MTHVLRIAHLRIALHVANPEVGNREVHLIKKPNRLLHFRRPPPPP